MDIPMNTKDNKQSRMDQFVKYILDQFAAGKESAEIYDESRCNLSDLPGISESEARQLARMFTAKGYHAKAYYIDCPHHGFRRVTIATYVLDGRCHNCSHSDVWG